MTKIGVDDYLIDHTVDELLTLAQDPEEFKIESGPKRQSQADRLIELITNLPVELFHDDTNEPYVKFKLKDHSEIWKVRSKPFKRYLTQQLWIAEKKALGSDALNSALNVIEAAACFNNKQHTLHTRVAWDDDALYYDLGNWTTAKITKDGWKIVNDPPILFKHYPHQRAQVLPTYCEEDEIFELFRFVNLPQPKVMESKLSNDQLLFLVNLIASFIPDIPHPIDVFHGGQGAAKTTISRIKKELLDPSAITTLTHPKVVADFVQMASHHWVIPFDNLTHLPEWLSDALCRAVTGDGFSKRELYTDDEDIIYNFRRCISINGINLVATKPDLLDRGLIFELESIPEDKRKEEKVFWDEFDKAKPKLLGALFSLLSKTLRECPNVKLTSKPRMADFAVYGCAVVRALGLTNEAFINAYSDNIKLQNQEAIGANPVAQVTTSFMDNKDAWEGTPGELLQELDKIAEELKLSKDKKYPKDARWLWRRITEVKANLRAAGIMATKDDSNHKIGRRITLTRIPQQPKKNVVHVVHDVHNEKKPNDFTSFQVDNIASNSGQQKNNLQNDVHNKHAKSLDGG
ncbi:MAG TPA: hypothetical protein VHT73_18795 [Thermodesulfobacteriota bacterium]|nr:hypothetical protein [Thermodesulfobacteriota bacterium]